MKILFTSREKLPSVLRPVEIRCGYQDVHSYQCQPCEPVGSARCNDEIRMDDAAASI